MKKFLTNTWSLALLIMIAVFLAAAVNAPTKTPIDCKLLVDEVTEKAGGIVGFNVPNGWPDFTKDPFSLEFDMHTSAHTGTANFNGLVDGKYQDFWLYYIIEGDLSKSYKIIVYGLYYEQTYYGLRTLDSCPEKMDAETFNKFDETKHQEAVRIHTMQPVRQ